MSQNYTEILDFLKDIAYKAGDIMKYYYDKKYNIYEKSDKTNVTDVDLEISKLIQNAIKLKNLDIDLFSEECYNKNFNQNRNTFVIDELDGTNNFINKNGDFAHCSSYYDKDEGFVIGLVYFPLKDKLFTAVKNQGALLTINQKTEKLVKLNPKSFEIIKFSHPLNYKGNKYNLLLYKMGIDKESIVKSNGSDLLDIISGKYDASLLLHKQIPIWDIVPSKVIFEELDYVYTYINNGPIDFFHHQVDNAGYLICHNDNLPVIRNILKDKELQK